MASVRRGPDLNYLSVCSGIEAISVAWDALDLVPVGFSEIEPFPCAVLAHRFPEVRNYGDMTKFREWDTFCSCKENFVRDEISKEGRCKTCGRIKIDVLVGGTPCQSFSLAGLRKGLADPRGNLALVYLRMAQHFTPLWTVWENVPGVLSSNGGRDFGSFLGGLGEFGYGWAYRVLDAQYFGVAQRRRRVFVVGHAGDWRRSAAVLFESTSMSRNPPSSRRRGERATDQLAACLRSGGNGGIPSSRGEHIIPVGFQWQSGFSDAGQPEISGTLVKNQTPAVWFDDIQVMPTLEAQGVSTGQFLGGGGAICVETHTLGKSVKTTGHQGDTIVGDGDVFPTLSAQGGNNGGGPGALVLSRWRVRRLMPVETERLQGFPDGWTDVPFKGKPAADGVRYKACGNSMAVPVVRWIGERLMKVDALQLPEA